LGDSNGIHSAKNAAIQKILPLGRELTWNNCKKKLIEKTKAIPVVVVLVLLARVLCDEKTLEAFHMKCQRQILHTHWSQHVTNAEISARTGLPPVMDFIRRRRCQYLAT